MTDIEKIEQQVEDLTGELSDEALDRVEGEVCVGCIYSGHHRPPA